MEDAGIISGSSLNIDYKKLDYHFIAYIGILFSKPYCIEQILDKLYKIPNIVEASVTSRKYSIICKLCTKNTADAKRIIFAINDIEGIQRTKTMISIDEYINDKNRLIKAINTR